MTSDKEVVIEPTYHRPANALITIPDPDHMLTSGYAEVGGRIEWRCESENYPNFEIVFGKTNPFNNLEDFTVSGTIDAPVVLIVSYPGDHEYTVRHHHRNGGHRPIILKNKTHTSPCTGCQPGHPGGG